MTWVYELLRKKINEWNLLHDLCMKYNQWALLDEYWKELWIMEEEQ